MKLLAFTGTPGCGKTTFINRILQITTLGFKYHKELYDCSPLLRRVLATKNYLSGKEQYKICLSRVREEKNIIMKNNKSDTIILDRCALDTFVCNDLFNPNLHDPYRHLVIKTLYEHYLKYGKYYTICLCTLNPTENKKRIAQRARKMDRKEYIDIYIKSFNKLYMHFIRKHNLPIKINTINFE